VFGATTSAITINAYTARTREASRGLVGALKLECELVKTVGSAGCWMLARKGRTLTKADQKIKLRDYTAAKEAAATTP